MYEEEGRGASGTERETGKVFINRLWAESSGSRERKIFFFGASLSQSCCGQNEFFFFLFSNFVVRLHTRLLSATFFRGTLFSLFTVGRCGVETSRNNFRAAHHMGVMGCVQGRGGGLMAFSVV